MGRQSVILDEESSAILYDYVSNGSYPDEATVVQQAFRALKQANEEYEQKRQALRTAVQEGFDSGIAQGDVVARVRSKTGLPARVVAG